MNPFEWVAQQFAGDWEKVQQAGIAMEKLGEFSTAYSGVITGELKTVSSDWQGNAADSANNYFSGLANTIAAQQSTLTSMGGEFKSAAIGMYETANAIKGALETLMDLLIAIGLELAAAAAATIGKARGVWDDVLKYHTAAWNVAQGLVGLTAGYLSTLGDMQKHALPEGNYDHPGV
ncbi:hypothetical protein FHU38_003085 [Saccharomonospora amisosensis]|uniref:Uncharacterized protein n=1 Tax=Saccharomonospora amisosensis TaxID=1128677 RepID=A0A7X5UR92_9PSEU|nr:hypothetical protein [Saccharomonospora amisosensis]NIJ12741.1 hypothetical protein [Saccharomonospora amisosensis]